LRFAEPIVLDDGAKLATLRDAIRHLAQVIPKAKRPSQLPGCDGHFRSGLFWLVFKSVQTPSYFSCSSPATPRVTAMVEYRAYTVGMDGHFIGYEPMVCADDAEAIEKATRLVDGHDVELWSGQRLVIRLEHTPRPQK
jgi:hypothetical protein